MHPEVPPWHQQCLLLHRSASYISLLLDLWFWKKNGIVAKYPACIFASIVTMVDLLYKQLNHQVALNIYIRCCHILSAWRGLRSVGHPSLYLIANVELCWYSTCSTQSHVLMTSVLRRFITTEINCWLNPVLYHWVIDKYITTRVYFRVTLCNYLSCLGHSTTL